MNGSLSIQNIQSQRMSGKQVAGQQQRNLKLLATPLQLLQHEISVELENNPALEIVEDSVESLEEIDADVHKGKENKDKAEYIESLLTLPTTLAEHLSWQLRMEYSVNEATFEIGSIIIENLDENGFFREDPLELVSQLLATGEKKSSNEVQKVISLIQEFDPVGCATHNVFESLRVQLSFLEVDSSHRSQIEDCLSKSEKMLLIMQKEQTGELDVEKVSELMKKFFAEHGFEEYFHKLVPYPGRMYAHNHLDRETYIIPDALITKEGDELHVKINQDIIPVLGMNESIIKHVDSSDKKTKALAKKMIRDAEEFIYGLEYRAYTLEKIIYYIAEYHRDYFMGTDAFLKPLTRKTIADDLDLHESTISRAVAEKYLQTDKEMIKLKYFFSQQVGRSDASKSQMMAEIAIIIEELARNKQKISDRIISDMLEKKNIKIARRTVTKYRRQLEDE